MVNGAICLRVQIFFYLFVIDRHNKYDMCDIDMFLMVLFGNSSPAVGANAAILTCS